MEITHNLPAEQWYKATPDNELEYWGLDYPPLSAWHSYAMGFCSWLIEPESVALHTSRGYSSVLHKVFMRGTVVLGELLIYVPALVLFFKLYYKRMNSGVKSAGVLLVLISPSFLLVDHGHFQYNNIVLGLTLWAMLLAMNNLLTFSALMLALALNYKQMALYYLLPFGFLWIRKVVIGAYETSLKYRASVRLPVVIGEIGAGLTQIAAALIICSILIWIPWLGNFESFKEVLSRVFPFGRGVFEDKVASFWCIFSMIVKIREILPVYVLVPITGGATLLASSLFILYFFKKKPVNLSFLHCISGVSLCFFLFSFHVHEKTILLPLLPISLLTVVDYPDLFCFYHVLSAFSLYPLLVRDGLRTAYYLSVILFFIVANDYSVSVNYYQNRKKQRFLYWYLGVVAIHILEVLPNYSGYPYVFEMVVASYCFLGNIYLLYLIFQSLSRLGTISDPTHHLEIRLRRKHKMI